MLKRLSLAALFCLLTATALAAEKDFDVFSIDMADGWELAAEPMKNQGAVVCILVNQVKESALTLAFAPTNGETIKQLAEQTMANMKQQGADIKKVSEEGNRAVFEGKQSGVPVKLVLTADPDAKQIATVVLSGNVGEAETVAKTIKTKNSKLSFY